MIPQWMWQALPWIALAVGLGVFALVVVVALRRGGARRPVLLAMLFVALLPALYVALVWLRAMPESYLRFGRPWATLVPLAAMSFVTLRLLTNGPRHSPARTSVSDLATSLAVLACALAGTSPELGRPLDRMTVVVVIDRSRSIDLVPHAEQRTLRELAIAEGSMREEDRIGRVVFAADAASEELPRPKTTPSSPQRAELARDASDISAGIKRALADLPADAAARIVLLSDGVATRGDVMAALAAAVASEIPIDVVPLEQRNVADVRMVSLRAPPTANEAETIRLRAVVGSPAATEVELRVKLDGKLVRRVKASVDAGETVLSITEEAPGPGLHRYEVEVSAVDPKLDETADDNAQSSFVRVRGPARVLALDGDAGKTAFVASALRAAKFEVDEGGASAVPADLAECAAYDVIIMGDIPASAMSPRQLDALARYVKDTGGGLILTGGDKSFGPGGYAKTPIEEVSPVSFDLKQERRRATLAEVISIDISGSMAMMVAGHTKLELANEAAARSAALLGAGDLLGVDHVDTVSHWSAPLAPVVDPKAIEAAIRGVGVGGGGIYVDVALRDAYQELDKSKVNLKHVLLFADGADAENITPAVSAEVAAASSRGITTSVVSLGQGHDVPALEEISRLGHGRFYLVEDATRLAAVFTQETVLASRSSIVERTFSAKRGVFHAMVQGVDFESAPPLEGYTVTIAKPRADLLLTGPENDPILATWQVGIGNTVAFTSDLKDRWGGAWTRWEGAARLLAQAARHVGRRQDDSRVRLESEVAGGQLELRATVVDDDGRLSSFRRLKALVRGPEGFARDVSLEAASAGAYRATVPLSAPGSYVATAIDELSGAPVATTGAAMGRGDELRATGSDIGLLTRIAEVTGGKRRDTLAGIFADRGAKRFAYQEITRALAIVGAAALLMMVAARRLAMPDSPFAWLARRRRARVRDGAPGGVTAERTLAVLLKSKKVARERQQEELARPAAAAATPQPLQPRAPAHTPAPTPSQLQRPSRPQAHSAAPQPAPPPIAPATGASPPAAAPPPPLPQWAPPPMAASRPVMSPPEQGSAPPPSSRTLTAAEILLAKRKARR
jgi:uncharacterized membrane protein